MTAVLKRDSAKVRAVHRSWATEVGNERMFRNVVTLDPDDTVDVWIGLSAYTPAIEFRELPMRLHRSLLKAIALKVSRES